MAEAFPALAPFGRDAFADPMLAALWLACTSLHEAGSAIDPALLIGAAVDIGCDRTAVMNCLMDLTGRVPVSANMVHYLGLAVESAAVRQAAAQAASYYEAATAGQAGALSDVVDLRSKLDAVIRKAKHGRLATVSVADGAEGLLKELQDVMDGNARLRDIDTCIGDIDRITDGLGRGDLTIIAARPSVGKTAMACNIAVSNALAGRNVLLYSFEMTRKQILLRLCSIAGTADPRQLHGPDARTCYASLKSGLERISATKLHIAEQLRPYIEEVESSLNDYAARHGAPDIVIVDYLQLVRSGVRADNRNLEIGRITGTLKELARTYDAQAIVLSQLRRIEGKKPGLDDLRDSGNIEQDADVVVLLSYNSHRGRNEILLDVDVAKNRPGATGSTQVRFLTPFQQMTGLAPEKPAADRPRLGETVQVTWANNTDEEFFR
jgi:replicative DNA helicase